MGCGSEESAEPPAPAPPATQLTVVFWPQGREGPAQEATLTCDPVGGTHPRPAEACDALLAHADALSPLPPDSVCTQIYGGPEEAEVSGTVDGEAVEAAFSRQNGCEIDRWDRLEPLLRFVSGQRWA